jgi:hypothetical protein
MFVIAVRPQTRSDIEQVSTLDWRRRIENVGSDLHNSLMFKDNITK